MTPVLGCDFSSSPNRRKNIVLAWGESDGQRLRLNKLERLSSFGGFALALEAQTDWVGGFDLPFGLPRELVTTLGWPLQWPALMAHYSSLTRAQIRADFSAFCNARPAGSKFAHRATDGPAGSSPSMKWVNPPVAYMLQAGVPLILASGAYFPALQPTQDKPCRVALEAYPGMLARQILGARSYKNDSPAKPTPERLIARKDLVNALELGQTPLGLRLRLSHSQRDALVQDATADALDAVICMAQAAWAQRCHTQGQALYGLPCGVDPLEGWIIGA